MKLNKRYATAVVGSLCATGVLSGVALAGNPHGTPPGHAKGQASASVSASATANNSVGVKAGATTRFNTHAAAGSNATKLYGNGKTAGQIAMKNGASASTDLYGPGNSQPHKASLCAKGKVHLVDVHALKAHGGAASCTSASGNTSTSTSTSPTSGSATAGAQASGGTSGGNGSQGAFTPPSTSPNSSGVSSQGSVSGQAKAARPVTGAANFTG
jgi:hypothetical protein